MKSIDDVLASALELNLNERAMLAEQLIQSLDEVSEKEAEELWLDEAERRIRDYRSGRSKSISAETVINEAREQIR